VLWHCDSDSRVLRARVRRGKENRVFDVRDECVVVGWAEQLEIQ